MGALYDLAEGGFAVSKRVGQLQVEAEQEK